MAKKRLNNLLHALQKKDPELINKYNIYPLYTQSDKKEVVKVYICLFTCTALQAIHLEIVEDQTASLFVRAFRQFVCKRGIPEYIISDNAKTFHKGSQELNTPKNQILNTTEPQRFLAYHQRKWKFITEWAPWWGGCYEKLIGLVKWRLKKAIRNTSLNFIELKTKLTEVEATLNSPPLTFTYTDINDGPPLTPFPFLCRLLCMSSNFARYSQWFRWFRAPITSIKPWFIKTSEIPSKDDTEFLGRVAKGTLNQCPRTTLITKKQTFLRSCGKNFLSFS